MKTTIKMPYGCSSKEISIPQRNINKIYKNINLNKLEALSDKLLNALEDPINSQSLKKLIISQKAKKLCVIISDNSRANPYRKTLPIILKYVEAAGISPKDTTILIATGTHPAMTPTEIINHVGKDLYHRYNIVNHNCKAKDLVNLGRLSSGNTLKVNKAAVNSDFLITTGIINSHYLAGFSGGRKSILPGIAGYETIRYNHASVLGKEVKLGAINNNPVNDEMNEALKKVRVDFNISFLLNQEKMINDIFAGEITSSFESAVNNFIHKFSQKSTAKVPVILTSPGGYPKDSTLYHSQKCINNVVESVKKGGSIIVFSKLNKGIGSKEMARFLRKYNSVKELLKIPGRAISVGGHRAIASAKILQTAEIIFVTENPEINLRALHFKKYHSWNNCIQHLYKKYGQEFQCNVIPNGNFFFSKN